MEKLSLYILVAGVALCAVVFSYNDTTVDYTITPRNLIWGITTIALLWLVRGDLSVLRRWIFPIFTAYLAFVLLSIYQAANIGEAIYESFRVLNSLIFLFCVTTILKDPMNNEVFFKSMVLITCGLGMYGIYQFIVPGSRTGTMGGVNQCSGAFLLLLIFCVYAGRYEDFKGPSIIASLLCLFVIFTMRTRSVWLALFIASMVVFNKRAIFGVLVLFIVAGGLLYGIRGKQILSPASLMERLDLWRQTIRMAKDHPLGVGAGNWKVAVQPYAGEGVMSYWENGKYFVRSCNDFLQVFSEIGPGGLFYLAMFVISLFYARGDRVLVAGIIGYMVFACFSFPHERPFLSMILMILMALAILKYHKPSRFKARGMKFAKVLITIVLSLGVVDFALRYEMSRRTVRIYRAVIGKDWEKVIEETEHYSRLSNIDHSSTPISYFRGLAFYSLGDPKKAVDAAEKLFIENPNHLYSLMNLSLCLRSAGRYEEAELCYGIVVGMYPDFKEGFKQYRITRGILGKT